MLSRDEFSKQYNQLKQSGYSSNDAVNKLSGNGSNTGTLSRDEFGKQYNQLKQSGYSSDEIVNMLLPSGSGSGQSNGGMNVYQTIGKANPTQPTEQDAAAKTAALNQQIAAQKRAMEDYSGWATDDLSRANMGVDEQERRIAELTRQKKAAEQEQRKAVQTNAERDKLRSTIKNTQEYSGWATDDLSRANMGIDTAERNRKTSLEQLKAIDAMLGNIERPYDDRQRAGYTVGGALKNTGGSIVEGVTTALDLMAKYTSQIPYLTTEEMRLAKALGMTPEEYAAEKMKGGTEEARRETFAPFYNTADRLMQESAHDIEVAKADLGALGQAGVDLSVNLVQMGADAAGRAVGLGMLPFFTRAAGGSAYEARQEGASLEQRAAYGALKGAIEVGTEKLFDGVAGIFGKGAADDVVEATARKLAKTDNGRTVLRAFAGASGEGTEEVISDLLDPFAKLIYNDQALKEAWENRKDLASDMLYDYLIGFAMGGLGAGGSIITGQDAAKNKALRDIDNAALDIDQQNAPNAQHTQEDTESRRAVNEALTSGRINNTTARQIAETPAFAKAFEGITGIKLTGTMHDKVTTIQRAARDRAQVMGQAAQAVAESTNALSEQSAQEAALEEAYQRTQNERRAQREAQERAAHEEAKARTRYGSYIRDTLRNGATVQDAKEIISNPVAKSAWEFATGKTLPDSNNRAVEMILNARENATTPAIQEIDNYTEQRAVSNRANRPLDDAAKKLGYLFGYDTRDEMNAAQAAQNNTAPRGNEQLNIDNAGQPRYNLANENVNGGRLNDTLGTRGSLERAGGLTAGGAESQNVGEGASRLNDGYDALSEQYGTIPAGENPFRESAMPQSTTGEDRVSRTARTIYEAEATPDARLGDIRQAVVDGKLSYVPVSNSTLEAEARQSIEYKGWNESLRDWTADVRSGKVNPKLIAMGEALINNAGNSSMSGADYISLVSDFNQLVSGTAQALQAVRIFKTLTPEAKLFALQRSAQSIADKLNEETKKQYNIEISDDLADRFLAQTTDEGRNAVIEEIQQSIADQIPSTWQERWDALRYTNMLGNFKTQIRNVGGNTVMLATRFAKDRVAATLETAASILTGGKFERTKSLIVNPKLMKEAKADFANVVDIAKGEGKYQSVRAQMDKGIQDKRRIFKSDFMEAYRKATNWAMDKGDEIFLGAIYSDAMAGWLQAHGINSLSEATEQQLDAARTYAIKEAQEATFRDDNSLSRLVSGFDRSWGQYGKAGKAAQKLTQGIVPFRKTPANVAVRAVEYSPLGLAGSIWKAARAKKTGTSGAEVINSFAKGATGTALAAAGYFLARAGLARGVDDDEDEAALNKLNGRLDWSIRIGDMDISLSQLAPMAIPFFMGVRFQELTEDGFTPRDLGNIFFATISDPMLEMSMLQGVNDAFEGLSRNNNSPGAAIDFAINALLGYYTQGLTNGLLSQLEQALTENRQTIYTDSDDPYLSSNLQYKLGQFTSKFPTHLIPGGHGYHQQDYLDAFGNTQSNGSGVERVFNAFINPVYTSKIRENNVTSELGRLMEDNKNVDNFPSVNPERPQRSTTVNGEKLTADEYQQYAKAAGNISQDMLQDFMRSGEYRKLGDEDRAQVVSDIYSYAREQAAKQILNTRGTRDEDITTTWKWGKADNAMNAGLSFGQYEAVKNGRETNTDNSYGIAVNKLDGLSDGDKLKALETFLPADKNGKRNATVRRYEAAMAAKLYFDTWTKVVDAMEKYKPSTKAEKLLVLENVFPNNPGYGKALYEIWENLDADMYIEGASAKTKEQRHEEFLSRWDFGTGA